MLEFMLELFKMLQGLCLVGEMSFITWIFFFFVFVFKEITLWNIWSYNDYGSDK